MSDWIDIDILRPPSDVNVMIKVYNRKLDKVVEIEAFAKETEDYYSWIMRHHGDPMDIIARPTHWKEIDKTEPIDEELKSQNPKLEEFLLMNVDLLKEGRK